MNLLFIFGFLCVPGFTNVEAALTNWWGLETGDTIWWRMSAVVEGMYGEEGNGGFDLGGNRYG